MAKEYLQKLSALILRLDIEKEVDCRIEVKHLFTGAALYVNKVICASWSTVGLAFKLPEKEVASLISSGKAKPLKYFQRVTSKGDTHCLNCQKKANQAVGKRIL